MRKPWLAMTVMTALGIVIAAQLWAFPETARETKTACVACHTNIAGGAELSDAGKAYKADKTKPAAADVKGADYVGNAKCRMCHMKQHKAWSETPHAKALQSLQSGDTATVAALSRALKVEITGSPAKTDGCVKCHVTGFQLAGGYPAADEAKTATVAVVGCESCHGPGSAHVAAKMPDKKKTITRAIGASLCMQCHTPETSPKFNFDEYAKKIHPVPKTGS